MIVYYELVKRTISDTKNDKFRITTAAIWECPLCGEVIDGMGGPGNGELCQRCGEEILNGQLKYQRQNDDI